MLEDVAVVEEVEDTVDTDVGVVPIVFIGGAADAATEEIVVAGAAINGIKEEDLEPAGAAMVYLGEMTDAIVGGEEEVEPETANSGAELIIIFSLFILAWCSAARTRS